MAEVAPRLRVVDIVTVIGVSITAATALGGVILWLTGNFANGQIANQQLVTLSGQVKELSSQVTQLRDQFQAGPRMDQLQEITRQLAAQAGRQDAIDARQRADEDTLIRLNTLVDGMAAASRDPLRTHPR